jgi:hypothetical protein
LSLLLLLSLGPLARAGPCMSVSVSVSMVMGLAMDIGIDIGMGIRIGMGISIGISTGRSRGACGAIQRRSGARLAGLRAYMLFLCSGLSPLATSSREGGLADEAGRGETG